MVRIAGIDVPNKSIKIALTYIYGVGRTIALEVCKKANIDPEKVNIGDAFTAKTAFHIQTLQQTFGLQTIFGRSDVQNVLGLKSTRSSKLLRDMLEHGIIEPVAGHGKGKYRFR